MVGLSGAAGFDTVMLNCARAALNVPLLTLMPTLG